MCNKEIIDSGVKIIVSLTDTKILLVLLILTLFGKIEGIDKYHSDVGRWEKDEGFTQKIEIRWIKLPLAVYLFIFEDQVRSSSILTWGSKKHRSLPK